VGEDHLLLLVHDPWLTFLLDFLFLLDHDHDHDLVPFDQLPCLLLLPYLLT
jgi:hypothetical protein